MDQVASTGNAQTPGGTGIEAARVGQSPAVLRPLSARVASASGVDVTPGTRSSDPTIASSDPSIPRRLLRPILAFARVLNPAVMRLAGRRGVPITLVRHRGRHSGQRYANPVIAFQTGDGFVISLPYGSGANWCRNILVSGAASIRWQGVEHPVVRAEVLGPAEALPLFPAALRPVLRLVRLRQFLRVHSATPVG